MWRRAVDVRRYHVWFDLVALDGFLRDCVADRVEQGEQLQRPLAAALEGCRQHHPRRGVRVLPAVLADAWHIALDVAGLERAAIERGREQQDHLLPIADQTIF